MILCCCRAFYRLKRFWEGPKKPVYKPRKRRPWIWIGAQIDGTIVDMTDKINITNQKYLTVEMLDAMAGVNATRWTYIDSVTLRETQFPSDVFIIEDDPVE